MNNGSREGRDRLLKQAGLDFKDPNAGLATSKNDASHGDYGRGVTSTEQMLRSAGVGAGIDQ